jgi:hypothetical protein
MSEMAPELTPDWHVEPVMCPMRGCRAHEWHGTPCDDCACETSCFAPVVIVPDDTAVPANIELGAD